MSALRKINAHTDKVNDIILFCVQTIKVLNLVPLRYDHPNGL